MRFALSAVAATSGAVLLGLAVFGSPADYVRLVRAQWDSGTETLPDNAPGRPDDEARAALLALQEEVTRLKDELAARQALPPEPPRPVAERPEAPRPEAPRPEPPRPEPPRLEVALGPAQAAAPPAPLAPPPPGPIPVVAQPLPAEPPAPRREAARPVAAPKPPLPRPEPVAPRPEADDARAVLARLRQAQPERERPRTPLGAPSPALPRLLGARTALANGRIDEARRRLQEAQLDLVFRPVGPDDPAMASAETGASDVARALEALSGNDLARGRHFIDRAVDDMSGPGPAPPEPPPATQAAGYAPAYPPR